MPIAVSSRVLRLWPGVEDGLALVSDLALGLFLTMALMGLQLWQLDGVFIFVACAMAVQIALAVMFTMAIVFRLMGRDYEAVVISAGFGGDRTWVDGDRDCQYDGGDTAIWGGSPRVYRRAAGVRVFHRYHQRPDHLGFRRGITRSKPPCGGSSSSRRRSSRRSQNGKIAIRALDHRSTPNSTGAIDMLVIS